jgi:3-oxoacyl-[acyl-carrier-protein] synthase-1
METTVGIGMIVPVGDNIISPLGLTSDENFRAVMSGISSVKFYEAGTLGLPETFMASLIDRENLKDIFYSHFGNDNGCTDVEKAAILSVFTANQKAQIDLSHARVLFILSTTKGNVDLLSSQSPISNTQLYLWHTAHQIADFFGNKNTPVVVSNACISGVAAQIVAMRELQSGSYDYAVVTGVDFLSKFIISGFQSFKALSPEICRPFDQNHAGLNLGEAAATIIYSRTETEYVSTLRCGIIRNDANHISAPSQTGEGSFRALRAVLQGIDTENIAFINAHGTATPYNDGMEAVAIVRSNLQHVPANSLKGYFGHTLGAAGVLESIVSLWAFENRLVLPTKGFEKAESITVNNESVALNISDIISVADKRYFIKMLSGFGGCNAVLLFEKR